MQGTGEGVEQIRGYGRRRRMPFRPFPRESVPGEEVEVPTLDVLRPDGFPQRPRDGDGSDSRGGREALLGGRERAIDPEPVEREGQAAEARNRVDEDERVALVGDFDDRLQGARDARGGLVVDHDDGLRGPTECEPKAVDVGSGTPRGRDRVDVDVMGSKDFRRALAEKPVLDHDDTVATPEEGVSESLQACMARSDDGEVSRLRRLPCVPKELERLSVRLDPGIAAVREGRLRELFRDLGVEGDGSGHQEEGRAHRYLTKRGSLLQGVPTLVHTVHAQSRIPCSETLKTASASGRFGESIKRAIRFPPLDFRR